MATRKSVIGATLSLDKRGFTRDLNSATREGRAAVGEMGKIKSPFGGVTSGIERLGKSYVGIKGAIGDFINSVRAPLAIHADYQDMRDKLTAIEGSADSAETSLGFLAAVGESQAMALEPLVEAHGRLVSLGYSAEQARDMIREIANAAEQAGAGSEVIAPIVGALEKIDEKGAASVKTLMQFGDTLPILRQILDLQFGVKSAADLEKLDLTGKQVFDGLLSGLKQIQTATASTEEKGLAIDMLAKVRLNPYAAKTATLPDRPQITESPEDRAKRLTAMQEESAARRDAAARLIFTKEQDIAELEITLAKVRQTNDDAAITAAEEKLALARDLAKVMQETGASEALATDAIKARVMAARELEKATTPKNTTAKETQENLAISTLRARGKNKQADKLEAETTQRRRQEQLTKDTGDPALATDIARQERKNAEDEAHFARTGRRRIHGAKSKSKPQTLDNAFDNSALTPHMFDQSGDGSIGGYSRAEKMARPKKSEGSKSDSKASSSSPSSDPAAAALPILKTMAERMNQVLDQLKQNAPAAGDRLAPSTELSSTR